MCELCKIQPNGQQASRNPTQYDAIKCSAIVWDVDDHDFYGEAQQLQESLHKNLGVFSSIFTIPNAHDAHLHLQNHLRSLTVP